MQWFMYGYGTGWLWYYYPLLTLQALGCFLFSYSLRFHKATWNGNMFGMAWNIVMAATVYSQLVIPLSGCISNRFLYMVPFQSPAWLFSWMYLVVRTPGSSGMRLQCFVFHGAQKGSKFGCASCRSRYR